MANVLFTRTDNPDSKPIKDGQIIFSTKGDGNIYLDNGVKRLKLGGDSMGKVDKSNIMKTIEDCTVSQNEEDVVGASVVREINDDLLGGLIFRLGANGQPEWAERGADTFNPFRRRNDDDGISGTLTITWAYKGDITLEQRPQNDSIDHYKEGTKIATIVIRNGKVESTSGLGHGFSTRGAVGGEDASYYANCYYQATVKSVVWTPFADDGESV